MSSLRTTAWTFTHISWKHHIQLQHIPMRHYTHVCHAQSPHPKPSLNGTQVQWESLMTSAQSVTKMNPTQASVANQCACSSNLIQMHPTSATKRVHCRSIMTASTHIGVVTAIIKATSRCVMPLNKAKSLMRSQRNMTPTCTQLSHQHFFHCTIYTEKNGNTFEKGMSHVGMISMTIPLRNQNHFP